MSILSKTAANLHTIQRHLDSLDSESSRDLFNELPSTTQAQLERLWAVLYSDFGRKNIPANGGSWSDVHHPGDSIWIPDGSTIPADKGYSNMQQKNWSRILHENQIKGIPFSNGWPCFESIAKASVSFDWEDELGPLGLIELANSERSKLHNIAFRILAGERNESIEATMAWKEKENLVWHEQEDCKTVLLVPREVHDNIKHIGGRIMLNVILG